MGVAAHEQVELNSSVTVVDGQKCKMYMKNFGEFFNNQVENAGTIVISRTPVSYTHLDVYKRQVCIYQSEDFPDLPDRTGILRRRDGIYRKPRISDL